MPLQSAVGQSSDDASTGSGDAFDQAFAAAAAGQSDGDGGADETDTTGAAADDADTDTDAPEDDQQPQEDTEEEGPADEASNETDTSKADDKANDSINETNPKTRELLAKLPPELRKEWNKHFTQKSQRTAAQAAILRNIESDPVAAAKAILEHHGEVERDDKEAEVVITPEAIEAEIASSFPAEQAAALKPLAGIVSKFLIGAVKPMQEQLRRDAITRNAEQVDSDIAQFKKDHPDYEVLEPVMNEWMDKIRPAATMTTRQYMDTLRTLALADKGVAERVKTHLAKMEKNAKNARPKTAPVSSSVVKPGSKKSLSLEESFAMASRGEVVGRGINR